jgi:hypothetical protein
MGFENSDVLDHLFHQFRGSFIDALVDAILNSARNPTFSAIVGLRAEVAIVLGRTIGRRHKPQRRTIPSLSVTRVFICTACRFAEALAPAAHAGNRQPRLALIVQRLGWTLVWIVVQLGQEADQVLDQLKVMSAIESCRTAALRGVA